MHPSPVRPPSLADAGSRPWDDITSEVLCGLREDRVYLLAQACHEMGLIDRLERERDGYPMVVVGSMGQPVAPFSSSCACTAF